MTLVYLLIAVFLLLLNAFFVLAEFAVVKVRATRMEELADAGNGKAKLVRHIQSHIDEYLSVCQVGITFASIGLGFVGEPSIARLVEPWVIWAGPHAAAISHTIAISIAYMVVSFLHIVLAEQVPKSMAIRSSERWALFTARPLEIFRVLFYIPLIVLNGSANFFLKLLRLPKKSGDELLSEEELRIVLEKSQAAGVLSFRRLLLVENIFDLGDLRVREAMRARSGVKVLRASATFDENFATIRDTRFSRYPLIENEGERPLGIVHVKDILYSGPERMRTIDLRKIARPYITANEETPVESLLGELQKKRGHLTIVLDKEGRWTGVISLEDVIEEIIGIVEDEFEVEPQFFLGDALTVGRVVFGVEAGSIEDAIVKALSRVAPAELPGPTDRIVRALLERERLMSTYLGRGLAVPHGRLEGLEKPVLVFARSQDGIPLRNRTEKAHLLFILLTPAGAPHVQVRLLARIGGIMESSEYVEERLREAQTPQQVLEAIKAGETASLG